MFLVRETKNTAVIPFKYLSESPSHKVFRNYVTKNVWTPEHVETYCRNYKWHFVLCSLNTGQGESEVILNLWWIRLLGFQKNSRFFTLEGNEATERTETGIKAGFFACRIFCLLKAVSSGRSKGKFHPGRAACHLVEGTSVPMWPWLHIKICSLYIGSQANNFSDLLWWCIQRVPVF